MEEQEVAQVEESTPQETEETQAEEIVEETPEPTPEPEKHETPAWAQKRFDKLAAQKGEAQREAEYWKQVALEKAQRQPEPIQEEAYPETPPVIPDRFDFDDENEYRAAQQKYNENLSKFIQGQNKRAVQGLYQEVNQARQQRTVREFIDSTKQQGSEKYEDFQEVAFIPKGMEEVFAQAKNPADIAYHLGQNPQHLQQLMSLPPAQAVFEIAKLDMQYSQPAKKKATSAPSPISPVSGAGGGVKVDEDSLSDADYEKLWKARNKR